MSGMLKNVSSYNQKQVCSSENLEDSGNISRAWDSIGENIKISAQDSLGYCEPKHCKPWFDEECSELLTEGRRLNYSDCRPQVKQMKVT
jgi:hypothetical protein